MLGQNARVIPERGVPIPVSKKSPTRSRNLEEAFNYDLNKNSFDPSKSSPPNDFLLKLQKRIELLGSSPIKSCL